MTARHQLRARADELLEALRAEIRAQDSDHLHNLFSELDAQLTVWGAEALPSDWQARS